MSVSARWWKILLRVLLFIAVMVIAGVVTGRLFVDVRPVAQQSTQPEHSAVVQQEIILYFANSTAAGLMEEVRMAPRAGDDFTFLKQIVAELARGPQTADLVAVIPSQTVLLGARKIADGVMGLDFNRELVQHHPGGSSSELLSVYALTNSIAANMPEFKRFVFSIEGKRAESLKGHVDLRRAIEADRNQIRNEVAGVEAMELQRGTR